MTFVMVELGASGPFRPSEGIVRLMSDQEDLMKQPFWERWFRPNSLSGYLGKVRYDIFQETFVFTI